LQPCAAPLSSPSAPPSPEGKVFGAMEICKIVHFVGPRRAVAVFPLFSRYCTTRTRHAVSLRGLISNRKCATKFCRGATFPFRGRGTGSRWMRAAGGRDTTRPSAQKDCGGSIPQFPPGQKIPGKIEKSVHFHFHFSAKRCIV
jgi:hypothetical protein